MKWALYNLLFLFVYPFLLPGFLLRMLRRGGYAARMGDRFALYPDGLFGKDRPLYDRHASNPSNPSNLIWIHAVSVGEVQVAGQLMREWRKIEPDVRFCFSTTSSTGWMMAQKELASSDILIYNPLDFPNFVKSALRTVRPRALILTESEIWPNFILQARRQGVPLFLINARVSDRSAPRYRMASWFFGDIFRAFTHIFAQSELDAERIRAVMRRKGDAVAEPYNVSVTGSFKFDVAHRNEVKERELRDWIFGTGEGEPRKKILLGGSTWPGEDEVLLGIYSRLLAKETAERQADLLLVLAPRHFEKADAVEANIQKAGFACVRRSRARQPQPPQPSPTSQTSQTSYPPVYLADTTGELMGLYGIADVVFVGKSLCAHGSQNMIEPCLCGKPTLVGPYTENFRPVMSDLLEGEGIVQVADAQELERKVGELLANGAALGARAKQAVERRTGVVGACVAAIRGALCLALAAVLAVGCSKRESGGGTEKDAYVYEPVRIASAYVALLEKPNAQSALLIGDEAKALTNYLTHAGVESSFGRHGQFDLVVVACGSMSAASRTEVLKSLAPDGLFVWIMDVREKTLADFRDDLAAFGCSEVHVWMPGHERWVLTGRVTAQKVAISSMLEPFARDAAFDDLAVGRCGTLPEMFANYAGRREDLLPAFAANDPEKAVRPEYFITREIPPLDWVTADADVDADIGKRVLADIRSMQVVRRLTVEGDLKSAAATDKKGEEAATEIWARALKRNPNDLFILERLDRLERNARGFLSVNKVLLAMKCYETMVLIRPEDAAAVHNFGTCLKKIGKVDMANKILARAKQLETTHQSRGR